MLTGFFAGILGLMYFRFSLKTISARRSLKISVGTGGVEKMEKIYAAHNNANNYIPIFLILLFTFEKSALAFFYLSLFLGVIFSWGRWIHFHALISEEPRIKQRIRGMQMTLLPILILSVLNILGFIIPLIK